MKKLLSPLSLLIGALFIIACGGGAPGDVETEEATDVEAETSESDGESPDTDDGPTEADGEPAEADAGEDDLAPAASEPLTAEDGWAELHDVPLPEPGRVELTVDAQTFATETNCRFDPTHDGNPDNVLFMFSQLDRGVAEDGREFRIVVNRAITIGEQVDDLYETGGESAFVNLVIRGEDGTNNVSTVASPDVDDIHGELLPLVHVDPSGGFTMVAEMEVRDGDEAVAGDAVLAGQCQDGWLDS